MRLTNSNTHWGALARLLHWSMAALIIFMIGFGFYMVNGVENPLEQFPLYQTHKSWGFVAFALVVLRLTWRVANRTHPALPDMAMIQRFAAQAGHVGLYVLMIVVPVSGWLMASASPLQDLLGVKNEVFGLFELPDPFVPGDQQLEETFARIHVLGAIGFVFLLIGHVGAALWHHFVKRDTVLKRMIRGE